MATLLITALVTTHEPPSKPLVRIYPEPDTTRQPPRGRLGFRRGGRSSTGVVQPEVPGL